MASNTRTSRLLCLPTEILASLPSYLHCLEDFTHLSSTCRALHALLPSATSPRTILRLASADSRTFFRPSPHFILLACVPRLSAWARLSPANLSVLRGAFRGGLPGLWDLCLDFGQRTGCGLGLQLIRTLHALRFCVINPLTDLIDRCIGVQWYATPDFWIGGVEDPVTLDADPSETFFHLALYAMLFAADFDAFLSPSPVSLDSKEQDGGGGKDDAPAPASVLGVDARLDFVKYCIPDLACFAWAEYAAGTRLPSGECDPRRACEAIGPYEPFSEERGPTSNFMEHTNQLGLAHLLQSTKWKDVWRELREAEGLGEDFRIEEEWQREGEAAATLDAESERRRWKQDMWQEVSILTTLRSLDGWEEILTDTPGKEKKSNDAAALRNDDNNDDNNDDQQAKKHDGQEQRRKLLGWRRRIASLTDAERGRREVRVGRQRTYEWPSLRGDLEVCLSGYVSGT